MGDMSGNNTRLSGGKALYQRRATLSASGLDQGQLSCGQTAARFNRPGGCSSSWECEQLPF